MYVSPEEVADCVDVDMCAAVPGTRVGENGGLTVALLCVCRTSGPVVVLGVVQEMKTGGYL